MRLSDGVEWGVHACTILAVLPPTGPSPRPSRGVPRRARGLPGQAPAVARARGRARDGEGTARRLPARHAPRPEITLLDVVEAIDGDEPAFRCSEIRRRGPSAVPAREYTSLCGINRAFLAADEAWRAELARTTIAQMVVSALEDAPRARCRRARAGSSAALPAT